MEQQILLTHLSKLPKTVPIDIEFDNLSYSVTGIAETKQILHSLSGSFRSGELTGILGPSGSGKTILIKLLVGYITTKERGRIKINNEPQKMRYFRKLAAFIMQEDLLRPLLTVKEVMMISAELKLGNSINLKEKLIIVHEVLQTLGLEDCSSTRVECLSGGQRKRLSIALELVDNPPVIILDEPTSGLDSVSAQQCVNVLRTLASQGKTVICTIHQPSVSIFEKFDQTYFIAEGKCVYNGGPASMIPFLESVGLPCPLDYSPTEYVIEIVQMDLENIAILSDAINNGKLNQRHTSVTVGLQYECSKTSNNLDQMPYYGQEVYVTSSWRQFLIILKRMWLQQLRNRTTFSIMIIHHVLLSLTIGFLFYGLGNNAKYLLRNFTYYIAMAVFFVYNFCMTEVLLMPTEIKIAKREYFNRWYSAEAYFFAITLRDLPVMTISGLEVLAVTYLLSNQPHEFDRFAWFYLVNILMGITSQSFGIIIGSIFNVKNGTAISTACIGAFLGLAIYGMGYRSNILLLWKILMHTSYIRFGLVASTLALLRDRPLLDCYEIFCETADTKILLRELGMINESFAIQIAGLLFFTTFYRVLMFLILKFRLDREFSGKIVSTILAIGKYK